MRQRAINIIKNVKVQLAYKTNSKEEEKPFKSDLFPNLQIFLIIIHHFYIIYNI